MQRKASDDMLDDNQPLDINPNLIESIESVPDYENDVTAFAKSLFFLFSHSYFDLQTKVHPKDFLISQYFGYLCQSSLNHFAARIEGKYPGLTKIQELSWGVHIASCVVASMSSDLHLIHDVNNWIDVAQMAAHEYFVNRISPVLRQAAFAHYMIRKSFTYEKAGNYEQSDACLNWVRRVVASEEWWNPDSQYHFEQEQKYRNNTTTIPKPTMYDSILGIQDMGVGLPTNPNVLPASQVPAFKNRQQKNIWRMNFQGATPEQIEQFVTHSYSDNAVNALINKRGTEDQKTRRQIHQQDLDEKRKTPEDTFDYYLRKLNQFTKDIKKHEMIYRLQRNHLTKYPDLVDSIQKEINENAVLWNLAKAEHSKFQGLLNQLVEQYPHLVDR